MEVIIRRGGGDFGKFSQKGGIHLNGGAMIQEMSYHLRKCGACIQIWKYVIYYALSGLFPFINWSLISNIN